MARFRAHPFDEAVDRAVLDGFASDRDNAASLMAKAAGPRSL